jgi:hypothetical protein
MKARRHKPAKHDGRSDILAALGWKQLGHLWRDPWNGRLLIRSAAENVERSRKGETRLSLYLMLRRVHEGFFMANPRFWYEPDLRMADAIVTVAMSNMRAGRG